MVKPDNPMRIDAHVHFWHYDPVGCAWLGEGHDSIGRDFLPHDLFPRLEASGFDGCIAVAAQGAGQEAKWLHGLVGENPIVKGVLGRVDPTSPNLEADLQSIGGEHLVGVRVDLRGEAEGAMLEDAFKSGFARLAKANLPVHLSIEPRQMPEAGRMLLEAGSVSAVLEQCCNPDVKGKRIEPWATALFALSGHPNLHCKISGLVTQAAWNEWSPADLQPYFDACLESFGPERVLFGSDWPRCLLSTEYEWWLDAARELCPPAHHDAFFGGNAARVYRLS